MKYTEDQSKDIAERSEAFKKDLEAISKKHQIGIGNQPAFVLKDGAYVLQVSNPLIDTKYSK